MNCPKPECSLSVSFSEVNPTTYSWKFRNDGTQSVYIQFKYTYVDANSEQLTIFFCGFTHKVKLSIAVYQQLGERQTA